MVKIILLLIIILFQANKSWAETYVLKTGKVVTGELIEETDKLLKVREKGKDIIFKKSLLSPDPEATLKKKQQVSQRKKIEIYRHYLPPDSTSPNTKETAFREEPIDSRQVAKSVDIYVTSWCPYCQKLESWLNSQGIPYSRHDIEADPQARSTYDQMGGEGIPITRVGAKIIRGLNTSAIQAELNQ